MLPRSVTPLDYLAREWLSWVQIDQVVCLTLASRTCDELLLCLHWRNSAVDVYLDHHPRALQVGWPTLRHSIDLCLEVMPQSGKGSHSPCTWTTIFFFKIGFFFLRHNYFHTQVHLLWSISNVTTSVLKCEPSFGLCSRLGLILPENKKPPKLQWLPQGSSAPASCSSTFPGCCAEGVSIHQRAPVSVYLWIHAHTVTSVFLLQSRAHF